MKYVEIVGNSLLLKIPGGQTRCLAPDPGFSSSERLARIIEELVEAATKEAVASHESQKDAPVAMADGCTLRLIPQDAFGSTITCINTSAAADAARTVNTMLGEAYENGFGDCIPKGHVEEEGPFIRFVFPGESDRVYNTGSQHNSEWLVRTVTDLLAT